jgi:hypothetical protein
LQHPDERDLMPCVLQVPTVCKNYTNSSSLYLSEAPGRVLYLVRDLHVGLEEDSDKVMSNSTSTRRNFATLWTYNITQPKQK